MAATLSASSLHDVLPYWIDLLGSQDIAQMWDDYEAQKNDYCHHNHGECSGHDHGHGHGHHDHSHDEHHDHHHHNALEDVLADLNRLQSLPTDEQLRPEDLAQTLSFLQQMIKAQIRALKTSSLPFMSSTQEKDMLHFLTEQLANIESILEPKQIQIKASEARSSQRVEQGSLEWVSPYKNWLRGTLRPDQQKVLNAFQWQTASGRVQPVKAVVGFVDGFAHDIFIDDVAEIFNAQNDKKGKNILSLMSTAVITKLTWDAITVMTRMAGAHEGSIDNAERARDNQDAFDGSLSTSDLLGDLSLSEGSGAIPSDTITIDAQEILNARCLDKIDMDWNIVSQGIETLAPDHCQAVSDKLQLMFDVATVTTRTMQSGQKALSEQLIASGTPAAEAYNYHHSNASAVIDKVAFFDQTLHLVLLAFGALHGLREYKKHGLSAPQKIYEGLKKQVKLAKDRPLTLGGALTGLATYAATHGGDILTLDAAPYLVVGALLGLFAQRSYIHLRRNKRFIFNLNAKAAGVSQIRSPVPATSLDQKEKRYFAKTLGLYVVATTLLVAMNNTGIINHEDPQTLVNQFLLESTNASMAINTYSGAAVSWAAFDRLDDVLYHYAFYGAGFGTATAIAVGLEASGKGLKKSALWADKNIPGVKKARKAFTKAMRVGKANITAIALASVLGLSASDVDTKAPLYRDGENISEYNTIHSLPYPAGE